MSSAPKIGDGGRRWGSPRESSGLRGVQPSLVVHRIVGGTLEACSRAPGVRLATELQNSVTSIERSTSSSTIELSQKVPRETCRSFRRKLRLSLYEAGSVH